ncbi:hypothetical protein [Nostoc commune]
MVKDAKNIGFYGFGSAAHILVQVASYQNRQVFAFTRPADTEGQEFAINIYLFPACLPPSLSHWSGDCRQLAGNSSQRLRVR